MATESQPTELVRVSWYWPLASSHWPLQKRLSQVATVSVPVVEWWRVRVKVAMESQPTVLVRVSWYWPLVTSHWSLVTGH